MNLIKRIGLSGVGDFKPSTLAIKPGATYLYGKNMLDHGNPNAAGKSLFASSVAEIFYDEPIVGTRQDKSKVGKRMIAFRSSKGEEIKIVQQFQGRSEKLQVTVDGQVKANSRTKGFARQQVSEHWPLTEEDYRTYGYLDSSTPHPLVRGTSKQRKDFFTTFFQLDVLDAEKKLLAKQLLELKRIRASWEELSKTFAEVKADMVSKAEREALETDVDVLKADIDKLKTEQDRAMAVRLLLDFESYAKEKLTKLGGQDLDDLEDQIKSLKARIRASLEAEEQRSDYKAYQKALAKYKEESKGLDLETPIEDLQRQVSEYDKAAEELEGLDGERPTKPPKVEKPTTEQKELLRLQGQYEHQLEHARKFKTGTCYACGQDVKQVNADKIGKLLAKVEEDLEQWTAWERYGKKLESYRTDLAAFEKDQARARQLKLLLKTDVDSIRMLLTKRRRLVKPDKVDKPAEVEDPRPLEAQLEVLKFAASNEDKIKELRTLTAKDRKLAKAFDPSELEALTDRLAKIESRLEVHNTVKARASKIRSRLKELEASLDNEEALKLALEAYSDKAVKQMAVEAISERLIAVINQMAPVVFNNYRFEFVWGTQVQLLVHRPKKQTTDVRKLSGAESKLFTLILVFALLMFVPSKKRLSLLTLDEPTASFSDATIEKFHALLPHLLTLVPSILIITPKSAERYKGAHEYTVYRDHTGAEIRRGHPDDN